MGFGVDHRVGMGGGVKSWTLYGGQEIPKSIPRDLIFSGFTWKAKDL